jgi:gamma-glutamylcyclotransferase (GGCT)/AIG2-like uncharacterized protein YtfP
MTNLVFFYGTLMSGFERRSRAQLDSLLRLVGRGSIPGALFDVGIYPAAIPAADAVVWGEVHEILDPDSVLPVLDEIEGYCSDTPDASLYLRTETPVALTDGHLAYAWVYFYNAPLGKAQRIESGDYLQHLKAR